MSVTIPSLNDVTDILDTDMVMVTQSGGQTYKISGADLNKRNQAVIASSTTLTGAPLKTGNIVRVHFTADITGVNTTTALSLSYNGTSKTVKVPKDGALVNFTAQNMGGSPTVYKYLQAYTTLELLYDGTNFVIIGNPVVISSADYTIYADGYKILHDNKIDAIIQDSTITDCNDCFETGKNKIYIVGGIANCPNNTDAWYIQSLCNNTSWSNNKYITQIATNAGNSNRNTLYIRHAYLNNGNRVWTSWKEL